MRGGFIDLALRRVAICFFVDNFLFVLFLFSCYHEYKKLIRRYLLIYTIRSVGDGYEPYV